MDRQTLISEFSKFLRVLIKRPRRCQKTAILFQLVLPLTLLSDSYLMMNDQDSFRSHFKPQVPSDSAIKLSSCALSYLSFSNIVAPMMILSVAKIQHSKSKQRTHRQGSTLFKEDTFSNSIKIDMWCRYPINPKLTLCSNVLSTLMICTCKIKNMLNERPLICEM